MTPTPYRLMIASPLDAEHVDTIRRAAPEVEILYEPDLLPPTRYIADHDGAGDFRRSPRQEARWRELAASAHIAFDFPFKAGPLRHHAPHLQWVQTTSAGVGQLVTRLGIAPGELIVTTASGVHARPLAEFAIMVLLMAVKRHDHMAANQRAHHWERFCADELAGKTLAIIGPGRIGREVARLARAFDMIPVALARDPRPQRAAGLGLDRLYPRDQLHAMLAAADALVLCAPHTPETANILDRAAFDAVRPGVILVNIGRGPLIDEEAMLAKLRDGTIRFAGLDVFREEPLPKDSPFWDLPNVLINTHSASTTLLENARIVDIFTHNLRCFLDHRPADMRNILDIARMY